MNPITTSENNKNIKQSKTLPRFKYKLSLNEQKVLLCFFGQIKQTDEILEEKTLSAEYIAEYCGFEQKNLSRTMKEIILSLGNRSLFYLIDDENFKSIPWMSYISYEKGKVRYKLNEALKTELTQLFEKEKAYICINPVIIPKFKNPNALRLYMIFKGDVVSHKKQAFYSTKEIKDMLELPISYDPENTNGAANQNSKIISPSIQEINNVSELSIRHQTKKDSRTITGWVFEITEKINTAIQNNDTPKQIPEKTEHTNNIYNENNYTQSKLTQFPDQKKEEQQMYYESIRDSLTKANSWSEILFIIKHTIPEKRYFVLKNAERKRPDLLNTYKEKFLEIFGEPLNLEEELQHLNDGEDTAFPDLNI